jgi:hypothetical protein
MRLVQRAMQRMFQAEVSEQPREIAPEFMSAELKDAVSSEALS